MAQPSAKNKIASGLTWKLLERFGVLGAQFLLQIILARMLDSAPYGMLTTMMVFISLANVFIQQGFNTSLIQNKDVTDEDYSSVLWVTLGVAGVLYLLVYIAAPWIAALYHFPDIIFPLRVLALMLFPGALNSVQVAKISREMDFKKAFISNLAGVFVSGVIGVIIALNGGGVWALVAQTLINTIVVAIVMTFTVKLRIRLVCNWQRIRVLFSFGWKLLVSTLIGTLYEDLRTLVIGIKYDNSTLGYYSRGKQFPQFIMNAVNSAVQSIMLPAMSAEQTNAERVKHIMRASMTISAYVIFPVMAGLAVIASPLVRLLLTDKWLPCVPFLQIYCFSFAFYPVHSCNLQAINSVGRSDVFLKLEIIKKAIGLVSLTIAVLCFNSPLAIAMTGVFTTFISFFVNAGPNRTLIGYAYGEQIRDLMPSLLITCAMCAIGLLLGLLDLSPLLLMLLQIIVCVGVYVGLSVLFKPMPYSFLLGQLKPLLGKLKR